MLKSLFKKKIKTERAIPGLKSGFRLILRQTKVNNINLKLFVFCYLFVLDTMFVFFLRDFFHAKISFFQDYKLRLSFCFLKKLKF